MSVNDIKAEKQTYIYAYDLKKFRSLGSLSERHKSNQAQQPRSTTKYPKLNLPNVNENQAKYTVESRKSKIAR